MAKTTGTKGKGPEWVWPQNEAHENGIVGIGPDGPEVKKNAIGSVKNGPDGPVNG
jgi:hypothetical protein